MTDARTVRATIANPRAGVPSSVAHRRADDRTDRRVLLCATPDEYWLWAGRRGEAPMVITGPDRKFCHDSGDPDWCRAQRAAGRCHLTDDEFAAVLRVQNAAREEAGMPPEPPIRQWEVLADRGHWSGRSSMTLAVQRSGQITIGGQALDALGRPTHVVLLYDAADRVLGLRPCGPDDPNARLISTKSATTAGGKVAAKAALGRLGLLPDRARRWQAVMEGGVLVARVGDEPLPTYRKRGER